MARKVKIFSLSRSRHTPGHNGTKKVGGREQKRKIRNRHRCTHVLTVLNINRAGERGQWRVQHAFLPKWCCSVPKEKRPEHPPGLGRRQPSLTPIRISRPRYEKNLTRQQHWPPFTLPGGKVATQENRNHRPLPPPPLSPPPQEPAILQTRSFRTAGAYP